MAASALAGGMNGLGFLFFGAFFSVHYGLFCFVHGVFVVALFGGGGAVTDLFDLGGAAQAIFAQHPNLVFGLASVIAWQAVQFIRFLMQGDARDTNPLAQMGAPYPRIIILHLAIIFGGFLLMLLNQPLAGLIVLALVKAGFDIADATGRAPNFGGPLPDDARKRRSGAHPGSLQGPSSRR